MKNSNNSVLGIDDERFDDLFDSVELLLAAFFTEVLLDEKDSAGDNHSDEEDIAAESEVAMGYLAVILAGLDAQIVSNSKNAENQDCFEIKLTIPNGNLRKLMRQVITNLNSDEFD